MEYQTPELSTLPGKNVLVTGGTGFTGLHLTKALLQVGAIVSVLARKSSDPVKLKGLAQKGARIVHGDVTDAAVVKSACEGKDVVFHLAALFRQAKFIDRVYYDVNVGGTENVLNAACETSVSRVVHCSTVGVHSHIPNPPADESEAYRPGDIYQETKCEGEKLARSYFESKKIDGVVVRPAMIWGDGDRRMLKLFKGVARRRFPVIGDGKTLTHWVYVKDLVNGFLLAADRAPAAGGIYIFAGRRPITISELVATIAKRAGVKPLPFRIPALPVQLLGSLVETLCIPFGIEPPIYRRRVDFFTKDRCFDTTKAQTELGYQPLGDVEDEIDQIYTWYSQHGWLN